ncbi:MAG: CshA/CshB family fibrillar adhesin-related protein [Bacteroidia bacterium]|nr:CshA/CshB family fibrillar adhesin-related protein [Bacteroidia bacterium]
MSTNSVDGAYADSGSGTYKDKIFWLTWENGDLADGIHENDSKTFTVPGGLSITVTFTNVSANGSTYVPTDMATWSGAKSHNYYQISTSSGEALYGADANDVSFTLTFSATLEGQVFTPDLIFIDPESTDGGEELSVGTNGSNWELIETLGSGQVSLSLADPDSLIVVDGSDGNPLLLTRGATVMNAFINAGGRQAITFGLWFSMDFGDAPDTYTTQDISSGAKHLVDLRDSLFLGNSVDSETDGSASGDGSQDGADEDGIIFPSSVEMGTEYSIPASDISITNQSGSSATLHAWIDFDQSGDFDAGEYTSISVSDGLTNANPASALQWTGISGAVVGTTYARFRLTSDAGITAASPGGLAMDGEIEDYAINITNTSLPVEWIGFDGYWRNSQLVLEWATANEINSDFFQVERKIPSQGMFEIIGKVKSAGYSNSIEEYSFIDEFKGAQQNEEEVLIYRLKQVDFNGEFEYSNTIEVHKGEDLGINMNVYPNPAQDHIRISLQGSYTSDTRIRILGIRGDVQYDQGLTDQNSINLNVSQWARGTYILQIYSDTQSSSKRLVLN